MRLTQLQQEMMDCFQEEPLEWVEGFPGELRTARSLVKKGLIEMVEPNALGQFEFRKAASPVVKMDVTKEGK